MDARNKTDLILLGVALILAGAVLGYTAFDAPPLSAPAVTYTPPAAVVSGMNSAAESSGVFSGKSSSAPSSGMAPGYSSAGSAASSAPSLDGLRINLNTATLEELMQLCDLKIGIGKSTVENIYNYRETVGAFASVEELIDIRGIGERTLAKLLAYVYVENTNY